MWPLNLKEGFYILELYQNEQKDEALFEQYFIALMQEQLKTFFPHKTEDFYKKAMALGHPDILQISPLAPDKNYQIEQMTPLIHFVDYHPFEWPKRFVLIHKAHLLTETVINKLLKLLEELPPHLILLLTHPKGGPLLSTLQSRAVTLPLKNPLQKIHSLDPQSLEEMVASFFSPKVSPMMLRWIKEKQGLKELIEALKDKDQDERNIYKFLLCYEREHFVCYERKEKMIMALKEYEESLLYNNSSKGRLSLLLNVFH